MRNGRKGVGSIFVLDFLRALDTVCMCRQAQETIKRMEESVKNVINVKHTQEKAFREEENKGEIKTRGPARGGGGAVALVVSH